MRIPPQRVADYLVPQVSVSVRTSNYNGFNPALPYTDAIALAARGEVEAVVTPGGKVRYLRLLADSEKPPRLVVEDVPPEALTGKSRSAASAVAHTQMGVYRQKVESAKMDEYGVPTKIVIGHVWAHCALRASGI